MMTPWNRLRRTALFQREAELTDTGQIIGWWETRRVPYNLLVGIAGLVSIAVCWLAVGVGGAFLDKPLQRPDPPLFGIVFYSGGWLAELVWLRLWRIRQPRLAVLSFSLGLLFSILLTLLPAVAAVSWVAYTLLTRQPPPTP